MSVSSWGALSALFAFCLFVVAFFSRRPNRNWVLVFGAVLVIAIVGWAIAVRGPDRSVAHSKPHPTASM